MRIDTSEIRLALDEANRIRAIQDTHNTSRLDEQTISENKRAASDEVIRLNSKLNQILAHIIVIKIKI